MGTLLPGEAVQDGQDKFEVERVRKVIADVYTFVRSQEYNRNIANFTFYHYLEFEKQSIKGTGRQIRSASSQVLDTRPTKLESLTNLQNSFKSIMTQARDMAQSVDDSTDTGGTT